MYIGKLNLGREKKEVLIVCIGYGMAFAKRESLKPEPLHRSLMVALVDPLP